MSISKKEFIPVVGFEDSHFVNSKGVVINSKGKTISTYVSNFGYKCVTIQFKRKKKMFLSHRLIAIHFIDNPNKLPWVNHIDANKLNNNLENLEWCTEAHNSRHAIRKGLILKSLSKDDKINIIKNWLIDGFINVEDLKFMINTL